MPQKAKETDMFLNMPLGESRLFDAEGFSG